MRDELQAQVLEYLDKNDTIANSLEFLKNPSDHDTLVGILSSLVAHSYIIRKPMKQLKITLTKEGENYRDNGSPEAQVHAFIGEGITKASLFKSKLAKVAKIGFSQCMKHKWAKIDKATGLIHTSVEKIEDTVQVNLQKISQNETIGKSEMDPLKKRKLITTKTFSVWKITKGPKFSTELKKPEGDLTTEMIRNGSWETLEFKDYDFQTKGDMPTIGCLHPLQKVRFQFRQILLEMGFEEMPTFRFVESSFWNFDALFQPQQHPARDAHDTFFVKSPKETLSIPMDYCEKVKKVHESGGYGSIGYRYDWKLDETKKNILRTHTTAISSQMLYKLAQGEFKPKRYFSIDRVFRNESLDATHLAEFHQVEGLIADRGLTLGDLIGVIKTFFHKIGIDQVQFKPAYNPYTEPSMEIFGFSKQLNKWMEIGNSGMFRPEMLRPMGLPEDVRVIAWGLGLERPTMIKYGIRNIRDLFGPKVRLDIIRSNPIARYGIDE